MDTKVLLYIKNDLALHEMIVENQRKKNIFYGIHRTVLYSLDHNTELDDAQRILINIQIDLQISLLINEDSRYEKIYKESLTEVNEIKEQIMKLSKKELLKYFDIFIYQNVIADIVVVNMNNV